MLLTNTRAAGGTLVLVGHPTQLPDIGAAGPVQRPDRRPDTITVTYRRRQAKPSSERRALADLRAGAPNAAVTAAAVHGRVHTAPGDQLADRVVADYLRLVQEHEKNGCGSPDGTCRTVRRRRSSGNFAGPGVLRACRSPGPPARRTGKPGRPARSRALL
jgi:hypothetical protein